jgi:diguanylate cyclase (GGDEF)-like protein
MADVTWQQITTAPEWENLDAGSRDAVRQKFFSDVIQPNIPDGTDHGVVQKDFYTRTQGSMAPKRDVGYGESIYRSAAGALSDTDQFARKLGGVPFIVSDAVRSIGSSKPVTSGSDWYFGNVVDPAVKFGMAQNIDPRTERQSAGARFTGGLARTGTDIGTMMLTGGESAVPRLEAGAAELIGNSFKHSAQANLIPGSRNASDRAQQVLDQGGSGAQALGAGVADFATGTIVNGVPLGIASGAKTAAGRFGMRAVTAAPAGGAGAVVDNDVSNWTTGQNNQLTAGDIAQGAASTAFLGGAMGGRAPLKAGDDLFGRGNASPAPEDPVTHAGVAADLVATRGYQILRGRNGVPYGISRGDGSVVQLNGRNINDVIDSMQQIVPRSAGADDQPGVNLGGGPVDSNVVDSTATVVPNPKQLGGPAPLALPKPADFEVDSTGQAARAGEAVVRGHGKQDKGEPVGEAGSETTVDGQPVKDDYSWLNVDPRENPEHFGLTKPDTSQDFLSWVAKNGGLNMDAFKSQFGSDPAILRERGANQKVVGKPLFKRNGGMSPDDLREAMQQHGWLPPDDPMAPPTVGQDDAHAVLNDALNGKTVVHPDDSDAHAHEQAVQEIEAQQAHAGAHNDLAAQLDMSPRLLASEIQRARESNMADETTGTHEDASSASHLEDMALHQGVDPMELHKAFFEAKNDADYAQRLGDLIKERTSEKQESVPEPAGGDQAQSVRTQPGDNGGAQGVVADAGGPDGAGGPGGRPAAAGVSGGPAPEAVASRGGAAPSRGLGAAKARAAITQRFGAAGRRLLESGKIQIHDTADTFPESGQHLRSDDSVLRGVHDTTTGITHIAADSVTEHNVNGVVLHEVGLHDGLRKVIGDRIGQLAAQLRVIGKTGKPAEKAMIEAANRNASLEHPGVRDEELIAHTIEHAEAAHASGTLTPRLTTWLADLVSHIKAGLFRMGVIGAHKLGINDIRMLAEGALRRVSREPRAGIVSDHLDAHRNRESRINALNERRVSGGLNKAESDELHNLRDQHDLHNPLSGLPNKKAFEQAMASGEYSHAAALDVDEFKKFNDNFGHGAGDVLLQYVGRKLGAAGGADSKVFHLSGDEYAVASKGDPTEALTKAQNELDNAKIVIHAVDDQGNQVQHEFAGIGVSFGVGHDYASADHAASASKEQRAIEGKRERRDGATKSAPPRRFVQTTGRAETPGNRGRRADDIQGSEPARVGQEALASRVPKDSGDEASVVSKDKEAESTQAPPVGKETFRTTAARKLGDVMHDLMLKISPMADNRASDTARAVAKDYANIERMSGHEYMVADKAIAEALTPEEQKLAWQAANEQSELEQQGLPTKGKGLDRLEPKVRAIVEHEQARSDEALQAAIEAGMFDGEGALPSYVPRMVIRRTAAGVERFGKGGGGTRGDGANVRTSSPSLQARKHLLKEDTESAAKLRNEDAEVLENIRTLPIATRKLWEAVNGRKLINSIKEVGNAIGDDMVRNGAKPGEDWFTMDHPAFTEYARRTEADPENPGKVRNALDVNHEPIYDPKQIWIHKSFEGPLKAILTQPDGAAYRALMEIKTKAMTGIMISPAIHLMTEIGRALPAAPGKFLTGKIWSSGAAALKDAAVMREALEHGLAPIGGKGGNTDAVELANTERIEPGHSLTAKVIGNTVGLLSKDAGQATKRGIDTAGKFWHETLLWDQIRKLQAGLYTHFRDEAQAHGSSRSDAARIGAHMANRFAGTLPKESMSVAMKKIGNIAMFSRTFTMGNFGVMKDALTGLPKDVQAQIMRDSGANGLNRAKSFARRAAIGALVLDTALMYVGNSLLQNAVAIWNGSTFGQEINGYVRRFGELMQHIEQNPMDALKVLSNIQALTPGHDNEPGKEDRILVGHQQDGTAIYMRNPFGKIGEEFTGWASSPLDMLKRKASTFARPVLETMSNEKGFGRKLYDPNESSAMNVGRVVANFFGDQLNTSLWSDARKAIAGGPDSDIAKLHLTGDMTGFTFSKGAPGGPAVGELYHHKSGQEFRVQEAMPAIREQIKSGDIQGAVQEMSKLGIEPKLMEYYIKTTINPASRLSATQLKKFLESATPEERERMQRDMMTR